MKNSKALGRLKGRKPVAVIDIGSNSVRLVVYEGLVRSPTVLFNEKILCGLGKGLANTGRLEEESVAMALRTLQRFRILCEQIKVTDIHTLATSAAREAENGPAFIIEAEKILGKPIRVLAGREEAFYSALGVVSSFYRPQGLAGDLGGGSLELVDIKGNHVGEGITLPLGGLRLKDMSGNKLSEATKIARKILRKTDLLKTFKGQNFYAIGGTWRNLAKLHMMTRHYPLPVMHEYEIESAEAIRFLNRVAKGDVENMPGISAVSKNRRQLLSYGATVLLEIMHCLKPEKIIFSGAGVREGFLYSLLSSKVQKQDPLLVATEEMTILHARSPGHAHELIDWTEKAFRLFGLQESENEKRYREAACFLSDIGWRIHSDYRGDQTSTLIALGLYPGMEHSGRLFVALTIYYRNAANFFNNKQAPDIIELANESIINRARLLGAVMRVANLFCASTAGILTKFGWGADEGGYFITVPQQYQDIIADRVTGRLKQLSNFLDKPVRFEVI